jgi:hypothetical protein
VRVGGEGGELLVSRRNGSFCRSRALVGYYYASSASLVSCISWQSIVRSRHDSQRDWRNEPLHRTVCFSSLSRLGPVFTQTRTISSHSNVHISGENRKEEEWEVKGCNVSTPFSFFLSSFLSHVLPFRPLCYINVSLLCLRIATNYVFSKP